MNEDNTPLSAADMESNTGNAPLGKEEIKGFNSPDGFLRSERSGRNKRTASRIREADKAKEKNCAKCKKVKELDEFSTDKRIKSGLSSWCKECMREYARNKARERYKNPLVKKRINENSFKRSRANPEMYMLNRAKSRAKSLGLEFNIDISDIFIPDICPLLGIKIAMSEEKLGRGKALSSSPSLDRVNPSKGYIKGNVKVISHLANMMKSNSTPEEIKTLAGNIDNYVSG